MLGTPSDEEYAKAAGVWFPELEIYEFVRHHLLSFKGCKELSQYVEEGRVAIKARASEIAISIPLIFYEFSEGTAEERNELIVI